MTNSRSRKFIYAAFFIGGIFFTYLISGIGNVLDFVFLGSEIHSEASFPRHHLAELYSRPGLGDQTFTLKVDGQAVYVSGDAAPGNLNEKLVWDTTGEIVTLELLGEKVFVYSARNRREVKE